MQYQKFGDDYLIRLDRGEEVLTEIKKVCEAENILLGSINGIGATWVASIGVFNRKEFKYESKNFKGDFEIIALTGNISTMNDKCYLHFHITIGNIITGESHSGHLNNCVISQTGEIFLHKVNGKVDREFSNEIGLNLIKFIK